MFDTPATLPRPLLSYILYIHFLGKAPPIPVLTRVFKSGNSLAVRIPKELATLDPSEEVEIRRIGNALVIEPVARRSLAGLAAALAAFPADFMAEGRDLHEQKDRDWPELRPALKETAS